MKPVRVGTRGSVLALAQSRWLKEELGRRYAGLEIELAVIHTSGDRFADRPVSTLGGKGIFTKEIEEALLRGDIDVAVHSMKDLPAELPPGLRIGAIPARADPRDVVVSRAHCALAELPRGAKIGTGSLRRRAQLLYHRPDLSVVPIRGNIDTRLRKLDAGEVDALVMAAAGLDRIGRGDRIAEYLPDEVCVSAVAQGALGIECREDGWARDLVESLDDPASAVEVEAERAFLRRLGGGCHVPVGARARIENNHLRLIGVVGSPDGRSLCRGGSEGGLGEASELGRSLAEQLLGQGADRFLTFA